MEGAQLTSDEVQENGMGLKWREMAGRLVTQSKWNEMVCKMRAAETDASADTQESTPSSSSAPADREQELANATRMDRAQVAFSLFTSAVRSRVSALRMPEGVAVR